MKEAKVENQLTRFMTTKLPCVKCRHSEKTEVRINLWEKGDDGTHHSWNKIGEVKDYEFACGTCKHVNHFMPI